MPIYAYRCEDCGHAQDFLQKMSDPLIEACPSCASRNFRKQVTAAGFQLKGGGWYVTDFRDNGKKDAKKPADAGTDKSAAAESKPDSKPAESTATPAPAATTAAPASTSGGDTKAA